MPRARIYGYIAAAVSLILGAAFFYSLFFMDGAAGSSPAPVDLFKLHPAVYAAIAIPIGAVTLFLTATGFWIGYTILTIKVVPPMPELTDKKDTSKIKAFFLCLFTLGIGALFLYGIYTRNFWSLAIPAAVISLIILGAIFWVGLAIITTRATLPEKKDS